VSHLVLALLRWRRFDCAAARGSSSQAGFGPACTYCAGPGYPLRGQLVPGGATAGQQGVHCKRRKTGGGNQRRAPPPELNTGTWNPPKRGCLYSTAILARASAPPGRLQVLYQLPKAPGGPPRGVPGAVAPTAVLLLRGVRKGAATAARAQAATHELAAGCERIRHGRGETGTNRTDGGMAK